MAAKYKFKHWKAKMAVILTTQIGGDKIRFVSKVGITISKQPDDSPNPGGAVIGMVGGRKIAVRETVDEVTKMFEAMPG